MNSFFISVGSTCNKLQEAILPYIKKDKLSKASISELRSTFKNITNELINNISKKRNLGFDAARLLAFSADIILREIISRNIPYENNNNICIVAIGGYGRGLLAPYSDIDLLFIIKDDDKYIENLIKETLYDIWDLKWTVGYSVHNLKDIIEKCRIDTDFCTALLERRFLWGNEYLFHNLSSIYMHHQNKNKTIFLNAKLQEREERHKKSGDSRYLVEPDLKNGKGGLRDLQTLYWIGKYIYQVDHIEKFIHHDVFSTKDYRTIKTAEQFLWSVRFLLHNHIGRAQDKISFDVQKTLAEQLGYKDKKGRIAAEHFMKHYFLVARNVGHITRIFCHALEVQHLIEPKLVSFFKDRFNTWSMHEKNYYINNGRVDFVRSDILNKNPILIIDIFRVADEYNLNFHPKAMDNIRKNIYKIDDVLLKKTEPYKIFRQILCKGNNTEKTLRDMNDAGVLGRLVPDFGRVVAMMQFNMYHHYTVDEHLIRTVGIAHDIHKGNLKKEHGLSSEVIHNITNIDVLFLAVFLHDIAKGRPDDHSIAGEKIARELAPKMGFSEKETDLIAWLVLHHLAMSDISQKRDLSDVQTIQDFSSFVKNKNYLNCLLCLTVCDIRAVGEGVWNGWKGGLLRNLYDATCLCLEEDINNIIGDAEQEQATYNKDIAEDMPEHFWVGTNLETKNKLIYLYKKTKNDGDNLGIDFISHDNKDITEVMVCTHDYDGISAKIVGALSSTGVGIYDAHIHTTNQGWGVDYFSIQDISNKAITDQSYLKRIKDNIKNVIIESGDKDFEYNRKEAENKNPFHIEPKVSFNNLGSTKYTIIEIEALDRTFLLYDLLWVLHKNDVSIHSAHIQTFGEKAVDSFYVKHRYGGKIEDDNKIQSLTKEIENAARL